MQVRLKLSLLLNCHTCKHTFAKLLALHPLHHGSVRGDQAAPIGRASKSEGICLGSLVCISFYWTSMPGRDSLSSEGLQSLHFI